MENFQQIKLDDISQGDLKITEVNVEVVNEDHNNVQLSFNQDKNALGVAVSNTYIKAHVNWKYEILFFSVSGVGDVSGPINYVGMNLGFETQEKGGMSIPKLNIQDFDISFNTEGFNFNFDCNLCPGDVVNLILGAFKGQLLDEVRNQARNVVYNNVINLVNSVLLDQYPLTTEVTDEMSIGLATTGPVSVKPDFLSVPIDGTVFLTQEGYNRPFEAPEIPSESPENPGEIILFISKYVYQTLEKTINKVPMNFETTLYGFTIQIQIDGSRVPLEIATRDKDLHLLGGAIVTIPALRLSFEVGASADVDIFFQSGDSTNMIFVDPEIDRSSLKLTTFKISLFGWQFNLNFLTGIANYIIGMIVNRMIFPTMAVPKFEALPLTATAAIVEFFETYTEAGVAFNFGLDN